MSETLKPTDQEPSPGPRIHRYDFSHVTFDHRDSLDWERQYNAFLADRLAQEQDFQALTDEFALAQSAWRGFHRYSREADLDQLITTIVNEGADRPTHTSFETGEEFHVLLSRMGDSWKHALFFSMERDGKQPSELSSYQIIIIYDNTDQKIGYRKAFGEFVRLPDSNPRPHSVIDPYARDNDDFLADIEPGSDQATWSQRIKDIVIINAPLRPKNPDFFQRLRSRWNKKK